MLNRSSDKENNTSDETIFILTGGTVDISLINEMQGKYPNYKLLCVDGGLKTAFQQNFKVDYIVGDFDTIEPEILETYRKMKNVEIRQFNPVKDNTDTDIALHFAIEKKPKQVILFGATGTRIDHTLGNLHILYQALKARIETYIIDSYNKIYMIQDDITLKRDMLYGPYVSFIPFTREVKNVTLEGFKYPLDKKTMYAGESLGVSNEVIEKEAKVQFEKGIFFVIEARD